MTEPSSHPRPWPANQQVLSRPGQAGAVPGQGTKIKAPPSRVVQGFDSQAESGPQATGNQGRVMFVFLPQRPSQVCFDSKILDTSAPQRCKVYSLMQKTLLIRCLLVLTYFLSTNTFKAEVTSLKFTDTSQKMAFETLKTSWANPS